MYSNHENPITWNVFKCFKYIGIRKGTRKGPHDDERLHERSQGIKMKSDT